MKVILTFFILFIVVASQTIKPFKIEIAEDRLLDLKNHLKNAILPPPLPNSEWEYGMNIDWFREFITYWNTSYDWRKQESLINEYPQFTTVIEGVTVHFVHYKILLSHGWPGSFLECLKLIDVFKRDDAKVDVICPSLPGYGFSSIPTTRGYDTYHIAQAFMELMKRLNYTSYIAQGGDMGAPVTTHLGEHDPNCKAIYLNCLIYMPFQKGLLASLRTALDFVSPWFAGGQVEYDSIWKWVNFIFKSGGYAHIQMTKPDTVAIGLLNSPVGLASWISEKFHGWSDCHGNIESRFTKDELLNNVMVYWAGNTITSSMRLYLEESNSPQAGKVNYVSKPVGFASFPAEFNGKPPRRWVEYFYNVVQWTDMKSGGHFAALEEPEALAQDLVKFIQEHYLPQVDFKLKVEKKEL